MASDCGGIKRSSKKLTPLRWRISLKYTLLGVLGVSVILAWFSSHWHRYTALKKLREQGVEIEFRRTIPSWLDQFLGDLRFDGILELRPAKNLERPVDWRVAKRFVKHLGQLDHFSEFGLFDPNEDDYEFLIPIAHTVKYLEIVVLPETREGELFLSKFSSLESLHLFSGGFWEEIPDDCKIKELIISDSRVSKIKQLDSLEVLHLIKCSVDASLSNLDSFKELKLVIFANTDLGPFAPESLTKFKVIRDGDYCVLINKDHMEEVYRRGWVKRISKKKGS